MSERLLFSLFWVEFDVFTFTFSIFFYLLDHNLDERIKNIGILHTFMGKGLYNGYIYIHTYIGAWDCFFFNLFLLVPFLSSNHSLWNFFF